MPRHGKTFLGQTKCNKPFRFQVKLCAMAPLCNNLMVSFILFLLAVKPCALISFPMRTSRAGGRVRCLCLNRAAKPKDPSSDHRACPTPVTSTKELWPKGFTPKDHATSPKDLGTYSPREITMRKPISAHGCLLPCACFGFASLTNTGNKKSSPRSRSHAPTPRRERTIREANALYEAKVSPS